MFKKVKNKFLALLFIFLIACLIFFKIFIKGLYPVPGDFLVSFYFPWYSGGWQGYNPWTTHRATTGGDSIRQQIPWLSFAYQEIKKGSLPLWNPYNFSGTPHLANIEAFIFYPLNFLFLILPFLTAWSLLIFLQFFLGMTFMYLYMKKIGIGSPGAIISSLSFVFSTFFLSNSQINIIGHTIIWLPLLLYCFESLKEKFRFRFFILSIFIFSSIFLAGNPQTATYSLILAFCYFLARDFLGTNEKKASVYLLLGALVAFSLCLFQFLPTLELYLNSPLGGNYARFDQFLMPFKNLITFLSPDFFGNPVTENFRSILYGDGTPNIGVIPLFFAIFALFNLKDFRAKFFTLAAIISLLFVLPGPFSAVLKLSNIPILSSSPPVRAILITTFSLSFLAGYGLDMYLRNKKKKIERPIIYTSSLFLTTYSIILIYVIVMIFTSKNPEYVSNFKISFRNLIIPIITLGGFIIGLILKIRFNYTKLFLGLIFILTLVPFLYTSNKILSFSPEKFFFPSHPLISFLKNDTSLSRFYGAGTAQFDTNFATYYRIFSPEGYGVLRIKRYAELIAASQQGIIPKTYERADTAFPSVENGYRKRIFDLLGVKYFLDKNDLETNNWNPEPNKFPNDEVELVWQQGKFKIYERKNALPRYFLTTKYQILNDKETISKIYEKDFDLRKLILEKSPNIEIKNSSLFEIPKLEVYTPNIIKFNTKIDQSSLLFLSDAYFPGWQAYIDNVNVPILRADYAFRAVAIPEGHHEVIFKYQPKSFILGFYLSVLSLIILIVGSILTYRMRK